MNLRVSACILAALLFTACGDPPNKEMDQAQGAIDAARAAGANRYAATEYTAAVDDSVQKAGAAMKADDYLAARTLLQGVKERIQQAMKALEAPGVQSSRRPR